MAAAAASFGFLLLRFTGTAPGGLQEGEFNELFFAFDQRATLIVAALHALLGLGLAAWRRGRAHGVETPGSFLAVASLVLALGVSGRAEGASAGVLVCAVAAVAAIGASHLGSRAWWVASRTVLGLALVRLVIPGLTDTTRLIVDEFGRNSIEDVWFGAEAFRMGILGAGVLAAGAALSGRWDRGLLGTAMLIAGLFVLREFEWMSIRADLETGDPRGQALHSPLVFALRLCASGGCLVLLAHWCAGALSGLGATLSVLVSLLALVFAALTCFTPGAWGRCPPLDGVWLTATLGLVAIGFAAETLRGAGHGRGGLLGGWLWAVAIAGGLAIWLTAGGRCAESLVGFGGRAFEVGQSIALGLCAVVALAVGFVRTLRPLRVLGLLLFFVASVKVVTHDLQGVAPVARVAAFLGLGGLMIVSAWVYQRFEREGATA